MTKSTRHFLFGSAMLLTVGLCTGLLAYYGGVPTGVGVRQSDATALLAYVPANATLVAHADVQSVMRSDLRRRVKEAMPASEGGQDRFREETGVDIENDVDRVVAFSLGRREAEAGKSGDGAVIITGRFDEGRLEGLARSKGAEVEEFEGKRLIKSSDRGGHAVMAFAAPGVFVLGSDEAVRQALTRARAGGGITGNAAMMRLIGEVDPSATAWAVGRAEALSSHAGQIPSGMPIELPALEWFSASGHVNGDISGVFKAEARDEQAAQNLRDIVQGFVALGRLQANQKPELRALLDRIQMGGTGASVSISFSVPAELFDKMMPRAGRVAAGQ
jgi:hypothetical protein